MNKYSYIYAIKNPSNGINFINGGVRGKLERKCFFFILWDFKGINLP